jgi:hypothetical protein
LPLQPDLSLSSLHAIAQQAQSEAYKLQSHHDWQVAARAANAAMVAKSRYNRALERQSGHQMRTSNLNARPAKSHQQQEAIDHEIRQQSQRNAAANYEMSNIAKEGKSQ